MFGAARVNEVNFSLKWLEKNTTSALKIADSAVSKRKGYSKRDECDIVASFLDDLKTLNEIKRIRVCAPLTGAQAWLKERV